MKISFFTRLSAALAMPKAERVDDVSLGLLFTFSVGVIAGYFLHSLSFTQDFGLFRDGGDVQRAACVLAFTVLAGLLILLSFSTSYLGLVLVPVFMFAAGFLVSAVLASLYEERSYRGLLVSAYTIALPLCGALPGFVLLGRDCLCASRDLMELRFTGICSGREQLSMFRRLLPTALILLTSAYFYFALPLLHTKLF